MVVSQHCSVRMPLTIRRPMPWRVSQTSSPLPTRALWRCLTKVASAAKSTSPARGRTKPDSCAKGFDASAGASTWNTRTSGTPAAMQRSISAFCAAR